MLLGKHYTNFSFTKNKNVKELGGYYFTANNKQFGETFDLIPTNLQLVKKITHYIESNAFDIDSFYVRQTAVLWKLSPPL